MAASTRSIHSRQRAAGGKSTSSTSRLSSPLRRRRRARGAHRPYSRNVGRPENSRAAPSSDEPVEQPAGGAAGHRRLAGRFGGRDAILGEQQVDDFLAPVSSAVWARRRSGCSSGAQDRRRGRGRRRRRARSRLRRRLARLGRPALAVGPRPATAGSDPEFSSRSAARAAASAAGWR